MCYCDVQTFQTKSTMYKQCQQSLQDSAKKSSGYWVGPPQRFQEIDAPDYRYALMHIKFCKPLPYWIGYFKQVIKNCF